MKIWLFDIDGTLIRSGGAGGHAMQQALTKQLGTPADVSRVEFAGRTDKAITVDLMRAHGLPTSEEVVDRFHTTYLELLPAALQRCSGSVLPGVQFWLAQIQSRADTALGLLTGNMVAAARHKLEHYQLWRWFPFGGFGGGSHDRDDVAALALEAAKAHVAPTPVSTVWVVGDTPSDIRCARAIQANVIAVATGSYTMEELAQYEPDVLLPDLSDDTPLRRLLD